MVTTDQQIEGVHFPPDLGASLIARRLLAVNLSDIAAMGAIPSFALLALCCPKTFDTRLFFRSLIDSCERFGVELVGGDLARHETLSATMTLVGRREQGSNWLHRTNARPEDALWVGGPLGRAVAGLHLVREGAGLKANSVVLPTELKLDGPSVVAEARRAVRAYLKPTAQLELGLWLARRPRAAAIDTSDGLALDLHRLCSESQVGAEVILEDLLIDQDLAELHRAIGLDPITAVLAGGEDYRLLIALPAKTNPPAELGCRKIGKFTRDRDIKLIQGGEGRLLDALGWDHFASA